MVRSRSRSASVAKGTRFESCPRAALGEDRGSAGASPSLYGLTTSKVCGSGPEPERSHPRPGFGMAPRET